MQALKSCYVNAAIFNITVVPTGLFGTISIRLSGALSFDAETEQSERVFWSIGTNPF